MEIQADNVIFLDGRCQAQAEASLPEEDPPDTTRRPSDGGGRPGLPPSCLSKPLAMLGQGFCSGRGPDNDPDLWAINHNQDRCW
jgi:hypothetical protein